MCIGDRGWNRGDVWTEEEWGVRDMFKDVPENHWAAGGIAAVSDPDVGLMHGYEDGTFRPDKPVTRAELAMVINRFLYRENNR
ncbi:hypothetical protein DQG23_19885 [Paenibacillus contaminans]|uniref:SLH domain-containing protein n=2 Tax=Paenibacillus contaminans TaxID=450362 RepID=A0A329MIT3_9BACL|nr:hypothetical protein DQG23_19885 [Paenibacillus contaminans]